MAEASIVTAELCCCWFFLGVFFSASSRLDRRLKISIFLFAKKETFQWMEPQIEFSKRDHHWRLSPEAWSFRLLDDHSSDFNFKLCSVNFLTIESCKLRLDKWRIESNSKTFPSNVNFHFPFKSTLAVLTQIRSLSRTPHTLASSTVM